MSQSDGTHTLTRVEFSYSGGDYKFNINPKSISMSQPHRVSVLKTQSTYVVDDFNDDVQTLRISGTTAGPRLKGEQAIMNLWKYLDGYANLNPSYGQSPRESLTFYNHTENYAFATIIGPDGYTIDRNVDRPLEWDYEINLIVLGYAGETIDQSTISGTEITTHDNNKIDTSKSSASTNSATPLIGPPAPPKPHKKKNKTITKGSGYKPGTQSSKSKKGTTTTTNIITGKKTRIRTPLYRALGGK